MSTKKRIEDLILNEIVNIVSEDKILRQKEYIEIWARGLLKGFLAAGEINVATYAFLYNKWIGKLYSHEEAEKVVDEVLNSASLKS